MNLEFKKIKSIKVLQKPSHVMNFSVKKNENYFANGILTHNCYLKRHKPKDLDISTNVLDILTAINNHSMFAEVQKPNQTHDKFISYDLGCNEDLALHAKYHQWKTIFNFFKQHNIAMGSFATKYVNKELLSFNPEGKIRIRFSLMPQNISSVLEPNTSKIIDRIKAIDTFISAGYDVHINFSPVVVYDNWINDYKELFELVNNNVSNKNIVKAEVIFLTHNKGRHSYNINNGINGEELIWRPDIQENKISHFGGENIRYKHELKAEFIKQWTEAHDSIIKWNKIRYIF